MNKETCVFEIGVEEIPAQYVATMADSFRQNALTLLSELRLEYERLVVYYTPRRFVLLVYGLADEQTLLKQTMKGPAKKIAFEQDGVPSKALEGFLKKNAKTVDDVYFITDGKSEYVAVDITMSGQRTIEVLKDGFSKLILQIYNPNPMRWGNYRIKFIRPIRWLMAVYGNQVINAKIECADANNITYGHRILAPYPITILSAKDYMTEMEKVFVIVDQEKRKQLIVSQIHELEKKYNFNVEIDDMLLNEVSNIVEYPTCAVGHYEEKYLSLPECIIKDPLKSQQRYFPVYINNKLTNAFIYTRNGGKLAIENVTCGNERVLRPRLEDAEFFYNSDMKTTISDKAESLHNVMFVDNGGSYGDKVLRIEAIALKLAENIGYQEKELIKQSARIMKADLVSSVVREYTNLQGLVGGVFARNEGYDPRICTAISEQYLPNYYGDKLPTEILSAIMSIADKLDSFMCLCAVGLKPAGSSDPYGLRRQILGVFNIALAMEIDLDLDQFVIGCINLYLNYIAIQKETKEHYIEFLLDYLYQRLRVFLHDEKKYSFDLLDKISLKDLNVYKSVKKILMIKNIANEEWYLDFLQIFNRIVKLIKSSKNEYSVFDANLSDVQAKTMFDAFYAEKKAILEAINREEYEVAIQKIADIGKTINLFMENNIALCDNTELRQNRLAFFVEFCDTCSNIIQFNLNHSFMVS